MNYKLTFDSSKQKNRFNLIAIVRNESREVASFQTYTIAYLLSWAEMTRTLISWFNEPEMVNGIVAKAIKNGGKNAS